jgi:hypothetical protein
VVKTYRHQGGEEFIITLRALGDDDAPPVVRLRHLLKYALRGLRLRCTDARETTPHLDDQHARIHPCRHVAGDLEKEIP